MGRIERGQDLLLLPARGGLAEDDDGPGLPNETAEQVFDPYFTTKPGGTGLGLSITRGIIEEHGGRVSLTSIPGKGCQVLISMPLPAGAAS